MTTFDDLVSDLKSESLLDEWFSSPFDRDFAIAGSGLQRAVQFETVLQAPTIVQNQKKLDLPDTRVLQSSRISPRIQKVATNPRVSTQERTFAAQYQNTEFPPAYRSRGGKVRKSGSKTGKKASFCKTCLVKVSPWKFHCPYCRTRVVNNLYYYTLLLFGFVIFTVIMMLVITSKTYK